MYIKFLFNKRKVAISRSDIETIPLVFALRSGCNGSGFSAQKLSFEEYRKNKALKINNKIDIRIGKQKRASSHLCDPSRRYNTIRISARSKVTRFRW